MDEEEAKKADKKSLKRAVVIICVSSIIAIIVLGFAYIKIRDDVDRQKAETDFLRAMGYQQEAWIRSENAHDNYTLNPVAMSLFSNITTTYPFLVAQTRILFTDIDALTNNVTIPNYNTAYEQLILCKIINKAYEQNITKYSVIIKNKNFTWMDYNLYDDVAYFDDDPPTSTYRIGNDGYWVRNYTSTLKETESKLNFISGVLDIIYTG